jgi:SulP family sulfate permease
VLLSDDFRYFVPRPDKPSCPQLGVTEILGDLYFGAVNHIVERIQENLVQNPTQRFLLLRMYTVGQCDISGIHVLENIVRTCRDRREDVFLVHVQKPVLELMQATHFCEYLGEDHFLDPDQAVSHLFHRVLDSAVCVNECPVRVFLECQSLPEPLDLEAN